MLKDRHRIVRRLPSALLYIKTENSSFLLNLHANTVGKFFEQVVIRTFSSNIQLLQCTIRQRYLRIVVVANNKYIGVRIRLCLFQFDHCKSGSAWDTVPVRTTTLLVVAMLVPASPSGGHTEILLPVRHRYREALRPLRSAFQHFLRQQTLTECHGVTSQSRMVLPSASNLSSIAFIIIFCTINWEHCSSPHAEHLFPQSVSSG